MGGSTISALLIISILLQLSAAALALRHVLSRGAGVWLLFAAAFLLLSLQTILLLRGGSGASSTILLLMASAALSGGMFYTSRNVDGNGAESEQTYRTLVETMNEGVLTLDREGKITYANSKAAELLAASTPEIVGTSISVYCGGECSRQFIQGIHRPGTPISLETCIRDAAGRTREVLVNMSPVLNNRGEITGTVATFSDITQLKNTEEMLREYAEKLKRSNELKDLFIDILHHDLLNYASIIKGYAEVGLAGGVGRKEAEIIKRNVERIVEVIENATKFSKLRDMERITKVRLDLAEVVSDVVEELQPAFNGAGMMVENSINRNMVIRASPLVREIFWNLLNNTTKYAREGKIVRVDAEELWDSWVVRVVDFGAGVPAEQKKRIFNRFSRVEREGVKGSGLGLAIAKRIAELHGGRVGVEDNPAGGSVFWVELPKGG